MSHDDSPRRRTGRPPVTSRTQILAAARRLIDQYGWDNLTLRKLAAEIGVGVTTLYHHVRYKEDLLVQLFDDYAEGLAHPALPDTPRDRIVVAATTIRDSLAAWPWVAEILTADDVLGESALWMVETIVGGAVECGCTPVQAVDLYRSIWYYTVGEVLVRARSARRRAVDERPAYRDAVFSNLDASRLPHLAALAERWSMLAARDTYAQGLRAFVDGLLAQTAPTTP